MEEIEIEMWMSTLFVKKQERGDRETLEQSLVIQENEHHCVDISA